MTMSSSVEVDPVDKVGQPLSVLPAPSPWFVSFCMVVIATSLAAILYLRLGMTVAEAGWIGLTALLIMVLAEFYSARARERAAVENELQAVVRITTDFKSDIIALNERIADIEATLTIRIDDMIEERLEGIQTEFRHVEERVDGLGDMIAEFDRLPRQTAPARAIVSEEDEEEDDLDIAAAFEEPQPEFPGLTDAEAIAMVRRAVEDRGPEIHLQSIVTLPQRKIRFYEALSRLKDDDDRTLLPDAFVPFAERTGIIPIVDNAVLFRSVQVLRRMTRKNDDVGIFCNISTCSLADADFFQQFIEFMEENRSLAGSIVFEFSQVPFDELGPVELANLGALVELGFRFSLDNVTRLDVDCATLADRGVRYVKVDADVLMNPPESAAADIHVADLSALLARYGITLIATRIESEAQVVDILDYDVKFGQGNLFSRPRLVRADALHTSGRAAAH